jgi:ankyrin repeat protein
MIEKLLSDTNLNQVSNDHATLLHAACRSGNLPALKYLHHTKGLSLTAVTKLNRTLIHDAVLFGNNELLQRLIGTKKIDINANELLQWLIGTKKIDINVKDSFGITYCN